MSCSAAAANRINVLKAATILRRGERCPGGWKWH